MRLLSPTLALVLVSGCQLVFGLDGDGDGSSTRCSSMAMLSDDFEDGQLAPWWYTENYNTNNQIVEADGTLQLRMLGVNNAMAATLATFDLREEALSAEISLVANGAPLDPMQLTPNTFVELALLSPSSDRRATGGDAIAFRISRTQDGVKLLVGRLQNDNFSALRTVDYDPVTHRVWQIAQRGAETIWSTSPDGVTFTELMSTEQAELQPRLVRPRILAFNQQTLFEVHVDNVNGGGTPTGKACAASSIQEDFEEALDTDRWIVRQGGTGCTIGQEGGAVVGRFVLGAGGVCELSTGQVVDLLDSSYTVKVTPEARDRGYASVWVQQLLEDQAPNAYLDQLETELVAGTTVSGTAATREYDGTSPVWLRLRGERDDNGDHVLLYETSLDGRTFEPLVESRDLQELDRVQLFFGIGNGPPLTAAAVQFDDVNIAP